MHKDEFIKRMLGVPWRNRASTFDECDCWGLVLLYYLHVLNIDIPTLSDYESGEQFGQCYESGVSCWAVQNKAIGDCIFVAWIGSAPVHVGLVIDGVAVHSRGENGHVRQDPLRTIQKLFTKVEYYTYACNRDSESAGIAERADLG